MASTIKVDKIEGSTGSTITVPTGQTLTVTDGIGGSGANLTSLNATQITSGTIPDAARLPTVTVAKGGTNTTSYAAGDILYASGATTLTKLVKGSDDDVLTLASGVPSWVAPAGGGLVKLATTTLSGTSPGIAFDNTLITSTYDNYYVTVNGLLPVTDNADIALFLSVDNGSGFATHVSGNWYQQLNGTGNGWQYAQVSHTIAHDCSNVAGEQKVNGWAIVEAVNDTTCWKSVYGNGMTQNSGTKTHDYAYNTFTQFESTSAVNYIVVKPNTGDLQAFGTVTLYGMVK